MRIFEIYLELSCLLLWECALITAFSNTGVPRDTTVFGTEKMAQSKALVEIVVCRISVKVKFKTEVEEAKSMISWFLFEVMFDNVLILHRKSFTWYKYQRSASCRIFGNVFVTVFSTEIQKNTSISSHWQLFTVKIKIVVSANRRNSRGS